MVFQHSDYELIDFGRGRKLERFGPCTIVRPCSAAEHMEPSEDKAVWDSATAVYRLRGDNRGSWRHKGALPKDWSVRHGQLRLMLKATPFGHVGVFPEQAQNWDWLEARVRGEGESLKILNLFAHTGGSTLACAAAGAHVVHVDSAKNIVSWARANAKVSGLADAPIRWLTEDAMKFVRRELRRGNRYDAIILDPPSYGHGPKGERWKLTRDLLPLLSACAELTAGRLRFVLLTCHTSSIGPSDLEAYLADAFFGHCQSGAACERLWLSTARGRKLSAGLVACWPSDASFDSRLRREIPRRQPANVDRKYRDIR